MLSKWKENDYSAFNLEQTWEKLLISPTTGISFFFFNINNEKVVIIDIRYR